MPFFPKSHIFMIVYAVAVSALVFHVHRPPFRHLLYYFSLSPLSIYDLVRKSVQASKRKAFSQCTHVIM